jgi:NtrC-family two-component system response regulator AlgB
MESATEHQGRILLVDDESAILRTFRYCLEDEGYSVATATSAAQAEALLQRQVFDLCFLDLRLGEDNGLDVLAQMRIQAPWMRVVIVTAHSAVDTAVDAIQAGAADYLVKPCSPDQLRLATAKQLEVRQLSARLEALEGEVRKPKDGLDSHSPAMKVVLETARQVATTDANILILGQLPVADRRAYGKRALRPQSRCLHRCQRKHLGPSQPSGRRDAVSRRNRRFSADITAEVAAFHSGQRI